MIPRRVHRIWLGPHRMPAEYVANAVAWEALGYPVHDWCEAELKALPLSDATRAVLDDIEHHGAVAGGGIESTAVWVQQADVYAYELVRHVGGIVANTDIEPLQDLGPLVDGLDAFVVGENEHFLSNALMGAHAGHPFFDAVSDALPVSFRENRWAPMNQSTGPHHLTACWSGWASKVPRVGPCPFMHDFDDEGRRTAEEIRADCHKRGLYVLHSWGHRHPERLAR